MSDEAISLDGDKLLEYISDKALSYNPFDKSIGEYPLIDRIETAILNYPDRIFLLNSVCNLIVEIEGDLIAIVKKVFADQGCNLKRNSTNIKTVYTVVGDIPYSRTTLIPANAGSMQVFQRIRDGKAMIPLDEFLGTSRLSYNMTARMLCAVARMVVGSDTYREAVAELLEMYDMDISPAKARKITDLVGNSVYSFYRSSRNIDNGKVYGIPEEYIYVLLGETTLYHKGGKLMSLKYALIFFKNELSGFESRVVKAKENHSPELITFIGSINDFVSMIKKFIDKHSCGIYKRIVFISEGLSWMHKLVQQYPDDCDHILNLYSLVRIVFKYYEASPPKNHADITKEVKQFLKRIYINKDFSSLKEIVSHSGFSSILGDEYKDFEDSIAQTIKCMNYSDYQKNGILFCVCDNTDILISQIVRSLFKNPNNLRAFNSSCFMRRMGDDHKIWSKESAQNVSLLIALDAVDRWEELEDITKANMYLRS